MQFSVVFYEAAFHTITVDADDPAEAERIAKHYAATFPGAARKNTRGLVRWHVEPVAEAPA